MRHRDFGWRFLGRLDERVCVVATALCRPCRVAHDERLDRARRLHQMAPGENASTPAFGRRGDLRRGRERGGYNQIPLRARCSHGALSPCGCDQRLDSRLRSPRRPSARQGARRLQITETECGQFLLDMASLQELRTVAPVQDSSGHNPISASNSHGCAADDRRSPPTLIFSVKSEPKASQRSGRASADTSRVSGARRGRDVQALGDVAREAGMSATPAERQ